MREPNDTQDEFFDATMDKLAALSALAKAAEEMLGDGQFDHAVSMMDEGCCLTDDSVWESVMSDVEKIRDIANQLNEGEAA